MRTPNYADEIQAVRMELEELRKFYDDDSDVSEKPEAWQKKVRP